MTDAAAEFTESRSDTKEVGESIDARAIAWVYGAILREQGRLRIAYGAEQAGRIGRQAVQNLLTALRASPRCGGKAVRRRAVTQLTTSSPSR